MIANRSTCIDSFLAFSHHKPVKRCILEIYDRIFSDLFCKISAEWVKVFQNVTFEILSLTHSLKLIQTRRLLIILCWCLDVFFPCDVCVNAVAILVYVGGENKGRGRLQGSGAQCFRQEHRRSLVQTRTWPSAVHRNVTTGHHVGPVLT